MNTRIIIIIVVASFLVILLISLLIIKKYHKKKMLQKVNLLDIQRNEILSLPFQNQVDKIANLTKGEQLEEKVKIYTDMYQELKDASFKELEDKIVELDFLANSKHKKEFNYKYIDVELELARNRYFINYMINELKELTSYEDKYRGIVIKLKAKYRQVTREYENNRDMYGVLVDTIEMQFENIEKRFQDFEVVINENLYNEVVLVVKSRIF